jgi:hypothetical protein
MKHILFTFMLLLASLAGHTQQTNEKSTMNRMENKPKILVAFFFGQTRTMPLAILRREIRILWQK